MPKKYSGFSLLEVIIVLALIGMMLVGVAHFKKKQLEEIVRQHSADAIAQEMYGLLKFINEDEIAIDGTNKPITNPLYTKGMTGTASFDNVYYMRVKNTDMIAALQPDNFLSWSGADSKREYFTNKICDGNNPDPTQGQVNRNFEVDYIRCKLPDIALNGNLQMDRVDLVGSATDAQAIDRVDFIVKFIPDKADEYFYFEKFKPQLDQALSKYKFTYKQATILSRQKGAGNNTWKQELIIVGGQDTAIDFGSVSSHTGDLQSPASHDYAIRFSFETGIGKYPKADGSVGVDKLCWNINKSMTGPCIEANNNDRLAIYNDKQKDSKPGICWDSRAGKSLPCLSVSEGDSKGVNGDDQTMHLTTEVNNKAVTGTLMANIIIENPANPDKNGLPELLTVPVISYQAFGNDFNDAQTAIPYSGTVSSESGTMKVKVQQCPTAPGNREMFPRLVAAISSVAADVGLNAQTQQTESDFSDAGKNRTNLGAVGRLAGVALQVNLNAAKSDWTVSATSAIYDNLTGVGINLINSKSISVVLTAWCSSIEQ